MNLLMFLFRRIIRRTRLVGIRSVLTEAYTKLFTRSPEGDTFDARYGTNTAGSTPLWRLSISAPDAIYGITYKSTPEDKITSLIQDIPRDAIFVDLGCGKGRVLMVAGRIGFRKLIGVDIAPELVAIAKENLLKTGTNAQLYCKSAADYQFPSDEPLAVYLYNPFVIEVMRKVVYRLRKRNGETWIVYLNARLSPGCAELFEDWLGRGIEIGGDRKWTNSTRTHNASLSLPVTLSK